MALSLFDEVLSLFDPALYRCSQCAESIVYLLFHIVESIVGNISRQQSRQRYDNGDDRKPMIEVCSPPIQRFASKFVSEFVIPRLAFHVRGGHVRRPVVRRGLPSRVVICWIVHLS